MKKNNKWKRVVPRRKAYDPGPMPKIGSWLGVTPFNLDRKHEDAHTKKRRQMEKAPRRINRLRLCS